MGRKIFFIIIHSWIINHKFSIFQVSHPKKISYKCFSTLDIHIDNACQMKQLVTLKASYFLEKWIQIFGMNFQNAQKYFQKSFLHKICMNKENFQGFGSCHLKCVMHRYILTTGLFFRQISGLRNKIAKLKNLSVVYFSCILIYFQYLEYK